MQQIIEDIVKLHNDLLKNEYIKIFIIIITSIFIGYTLQPVPSWLDNLFTKSNLFKFIIIFYGGLVTLNTVSSHQIIILFIVSIVILYLFEEFRR